MSVSITLPEQTCPHCAKTFTPALPSRPDVPTAEQPTITLTVAKFGMIMGLLRQLADKCRRDGFITEYVGDQKAATVTLSVAMPQPKALPDDAHLP